MTLARVTAPLALACSILVACGERRVARPPSTGPAEGLCSADGFCWLEPVPFGTSLTAVALPSAGEAWLAGPRGAVIRWTGGTWSWVATGVPWTARGVWAAADGAPGLARVLVAGEALLRREGDAFVEAHRPPGDAVYLAVHGSDPANVWAVGTGGLASHFDGTSWTDLPLPGEHGEVVSVFALPGGVAFACVRDGGRVYRFADGRWTRITHGDGADGYVMALALAVWASSPTDVWVAGLGEQSKAFGKPHLHRWDGARWTPHLVPELDRSMLTGLAGSGPEDLWVIARAFGRENAARWDGHAWTAAFLPEGLATLALTPGGDGLAVGERGVVARYAGGAWTALLPGQRHALDHADAQAGVAWLATAEGVGPTRFMRVDADGLSEVPAPPGAPHVEGLSVAPDGAPWIADGRSFARWDGRAWQAFDPGALGGVHGLHAAAPDRVWLAGDFFLGRWDGAALTAWPAPYGFYRIWATGPEEAWAVGGFLEPHRFDGEVWRPEPLHQDRLLWDLWASAPDDVWVVGGHGLAARHDGERWHVLETGTDIDLTAVAGDGRGRVWITRGDGVVLAWDGERFQTLETGSLGWLSAAAWDDTLGLLVGGVEGSVLRTGGP